MSDQSFVKEERPNARIERQEKNGGEEYFLIRFGASATPFADGNTSEEAWAKAAERLRRMRASGR